MVNEMAKKLHSGCTDSGLLDILCGSSEVFHCDFFLNFILYSATYSPKLLNERENTRGERDDGIKWAMKK